MSREVRRVPKDWQHPRGSGGDYVPLFGRSYAADLEEWETNFAQWRRGYRDDWHGGWTPRVGAELNMSFEEWYGERPRAERYMPDWPDVARTHLQMYESTTEGTPISPVMATAEELADWLASNGASAFAFEVATYEQWLSMIRGEGYAPTFVQEGGEFESGVAWVGKK